jgi:uncharacterized protein
MDGIELIRHMYALFGRGDIPNLVALFDPRIEWREAEGNPAEPSGMPWIGPDEITEKLFKQVGTSWEGFTFTPQRFHQAGDTVVVEGRYTGVSKATGRRMDAQVCHVWTLRAGKVAAFQQYVDTAQLQWVTASGLAAQAAVRDARLPEVPTSH